MIWWRRWKIKITRLDMGVCTCFVTLLRGALCGHDWSGDGGDEPLLELCWRALPFTVTSRTPAWWWATGKWTGLFWFPATGGTTGFVVAASSCWDAAPCCPAVVVVTLTVWDMCRGARMSSSTAPARLDPLRLACWRSQPVRLQFCKISIAIEFITIRRKKPQSQSRMI